jgi:sec-independent protein translocase protein TatB
MSGVGFWELVLLFVIGLIVLGPERLPRVANQLGTWIGQARRMTRALRRQLEDELNFDKDLNIRPYRSPQALPHKRPAEQHEPAAEKDDKYSPAHDADSPGTGVGDTEASSEPDFADTDVLEQPRGTRSAAAPDDGKMGDGTETDGRT